MRNILSDFGAVGDGIFMNTEVFRNAIVASRGGILIVPKGIFRTGTVRLESHLTLELEEGAVIVGSENIDDYQPDSMDRYAQGRYLFEAFGSEDITVCGPGIVDGAGSTFWEKKFINSGTETPPVNPVLVYDVRKPKVMRPAAMFYFSECSAIRIEGIKLRSAAAYTVWCVGCDGVCLRDITVRNSLDGPNTDVFDIDCSSNVRIERCDLCAGDDCIAIKSDPYRTGTKRITENIVVSDCQLSSVTCAIRIGYEGDAPIRNCLFENIRIANSGHGIDILSIVPKVRSGYQLKVERGTPMDNLVFDRIEMINVRQAIFVWAGHQQGKYSAYIRNLVFSNIRAEALASGFIGCMEKDYALSNIIFENVELRIRDSGHRFSPVLETFPSCWGGWCDSGAVLYLKHVRNISMKNMCFSSERTEDRDLILDDVLELKSDFGK